MDVLSRYKYWKGKGYVLLADGRTSEASEELEVIQSYAGMYRAKITYKSDFEAHVDDISLAYTGRGTYQGVESSNPSLVTGKVHRRYHRLELILGEFNTDTPPTALVRIILYPVRKR